MSVPLSVLDLAKVGPETPPAQAVRDVVDVARAADESGYHRFWVAEHHASPRTAGSAPVVLIAAVAAATRRIRAGSGGVMLPNHAPLVVAEQFAVLEALHPGRIDLGVGRSSGGSKAGRHLEAALRRDAKATSDFPALVDELLAFQHPELHPAHPYPSVEVSPRVDTSADVFVLGSSENGARVAAERSLPFVYGHHLGLGKARPAAVSAYRSAFVPGPYGSRPKVLASVNVVCAETDALAADLALAAARDEVRARAETPLTEARELYLAHKAVTDAAVLHGSRATVLAGAARLAEDLTADELILVPYETSGPARVRTVREAGLPALVAS
ncbi:MsnO8 family LLM class oxidoreductase [Amycolatopsis sp. NPDC049253]|uniref:MsnO8 family LLM class oxidoreductase n=1 Tax=Amycolatopsis sp. NPDC049253 TaxID=3155274 RepID=UPI0034290332